MKHSAPLHRVIFEYADSKEWVVFDKLWPFSIYDLLGKEIRKPRVLIREGPGKWVSVTHTELVQYLFDEASDDHERFLAALAKGFPEEPTVSDGNPHEFGSDAYVRWYKKRKRDHIAESLVLSNDIKSHQ